LTKIGAEGLNALELFGINRTRPLLLLAAQFRFGAGQIAQAGFPCVLQAARDEAVLRLYGSIAAFGAFGFMA